MTELMELDRATLLRVRFQEFGDRYIRCLDDRRFDEWLDFFLEDAVYNILPRENLEDGFETSLLLLDSNAARRDRLMCVRDVIVHQRATSRHLISGLQVTHQASGAYAVLSNFLVAHSDYEGNTKVFATGEYRDVIVEREGALKFRERLVVLGSFNIQSQLIDPL